MAAVTVDIVLQLQESKSSRPHIQIRLVVHVHDSLSFSSVNVTFRNDSYDANGKRKSLLQLTWNKFTWKFKGACNYIILALRYLCFGETVMDCCTHVATDQEGCA